MLTWLRDWWRGYSDADMGSMLLKMRGSKEYLRHDGLIEFSRGEMNAHRAYFYFVGLADARLRQLPPSLWPRKPARA